MFGNIWRKDKFSSQFHKSKNIALQLLGSDGNLWLRHSIADGVMMMRTAEDMAQSSRKSETREGTTQSSTKSTPTFRTELIYSKSVADDLGIFYEIPSLKGSTNSTLPHGGSGSQHGNCQGADTDHIQTMANYNMTLQTNVVYLLCSMTNKKLRDRN